jgi:hypothetical protein
MKTLKLVVLIYIALFCSMNVWACKARRYTENFPVEICKNYDYILIVNIDKSVHSEELFYSPLITFEATVLESLKGDVIAGDSIAGGHQKEEARAVCPVHLDEGGVYLLLLSKVGNKFLVSRFSFPVKDNNKYFETYIKQIKAEVNID